LKKRFWAALLAVLMITNICACNYVSKDDIGEETIENTDTDESNFEETDEKATESETNADIKPPRKSPAFYNGVSGNSNVTYTFNQNSEFSVHIADWSEYHLVTSLTDKDINAVKYHATAVGAYSESAFLILTRFYESKITVVSFEKGSQSETVVNLDVDKFIHEVSVSFINENVGYLFAFKEAEEAVHSRGSLELSNLFKTEDGGKTWHSINVQNIPLLDLRNYIKFAKMISENVGLISGEIGPADYDLCERTLLTTDGGLNWVKVNIPELPQDDDLHWAVVVDFTLIDESYILTIRYKISETDYAYAKYKLTDQNIWVRIN